MLLCVAVSLVFSLGFCEWVMHTFWYLVGQYFSIAIFSNRTSPPLPYEAAIENARISKNISQKLSKPDKISLFLLIEKYKSKNVIFRCY